MAKILIALGGNALGFTPDEQKKAISKITPLFIDLIKQKHDIVISHGNGPQVGLISTAFEEYQLSAPDFSRMPFPECGAMSQGYIGYHLQNSIKNELVSNGLDLDVCTIITQVLVDKLDPAFSNPTKPVGKFFTKEDMDKLSKESNLMFVEDAGRGYRRVVASPVPMDIIEKNTIKKLIEGKSIVIACGGGGVPVIDNDGVLEGVEAVIDKDYASQKLAEMIEADIFVILTAVDQVYLNYKQKNEIALSDIQPAELQKYIDEDHFAPGSMLPKVKAALNFVENSKERMSIITSIEKVKEAINGNAGTIIRESTAETHSQNMSK